MDRLPQGQSSVRLQGSPRMLPQMAPRHRLQRACHLHRAISLTRPLAQLSPLHHPPQQRAALSLVICSEVCPRPQLRRRPSRLVYSQLSLPPSRTPLPALHRRSPRLPHRRARHRHCRTFSQWNCRRSRHHQRRPLRHSRRHLWQRRGSVHRMPQTTCSRLCTTRALRLSYASRYSSHREFQGVRSLSVSPR